MGTKDNKGIKKKIIHNRNGHDIHLLNYINDFYSEKAKIELDANKFVGEINLEYAFKKINEYYFKGKLDAPIILFPTDMQPFIKVNESKQLFKDNMIGDKFNFRIISISDKYLKEDYLDKCGLKEKKDYISDINVIKTFVYTALMNTVLICVDMEMQDSKEGISGDKGKKLFGKDGIYINKYGRAICELYGLEFIEKVDRDNRKYLVRPGEKFINDLVNMNLIEYNTPLKNLITIFNSQKAEQKNKSIYEKGETDNNEN